MISAPSHRQQLNGSKLIILLLGLSLGFSACGIFGPKGVKGDPKITDPDTDETDQVVKSKVDTVLLRDITEISTPPITESKEPTFVGEKKSAYDVAMLFPFNAIRYQNLGNAPDSKGNRFIQYYGGARIAIDDLMSEGKRVNVHTFDTEESESKVMSLLNDQSVIDADLIIGPYRTSNLKTVAEFGNERHIPVVSPWVPGFEMDGKNPFLVQMTPGLSAHAEAIFEYIEKNYSEYNVFVVVRNEASELNRLQIFKEAYQLASSKPDSLKELIIDDNTSDLQNTDMSTIMQNGKKAIFVVPYYSRSEESFINSVLRKLHAERFGDAESAYQKDIIVFGMPQWLTFRELNYDYLESLRAHVSTISFTDSDHPKCVNFKTRFFDRYGIVPDPAAFQGYDLMYYFGTMLHEKGTGFLSELENNLTRPMNLGLDLQPVYSTSIPDRNLNEQVLYYENRGIRILEFRDLEFHLINGQ